MVKSLFTLGIIFSLACAGYAQTYMEKKSQHRFAQTYLGLRSVWQPQQGILHLGNGPQAFSAKSTTNFAIGGLHFWGKLDFHMNFSFSERPQNIDQFEIDQRFGGEFSARYYPWRLEAHKIRPFVGVGATLSSLVISDSLNAVRGDIFFHPSLIGGISFMHRKWQVNLEASYLANHKHHFYVNTSRKEALELPNLYFSVGLRRYFETTLSNERREENGSTKRIFEQLKEDNKLNSFSLALGPSAGYFVAAPTYTAAGLSSLPKQKVAFNWDMGIGYFWHKANVHAGFTYRNYSSNAKSYELEEVIRRKSIAFEAYKFIWDYNGFVPFVGLSLSRESWATAQFIEDESQGTKVSEFFSPGIIVGWDIASSPIETWLLRTNLRYYPYQQMTTIDGTKQRVDQFEFNFIQLVLYPNRLYHVTKARNAL